MQAPKADSANDSAAAAFPVMLAKPKGAFLEKWLEAAVRSNSVATSLVITAEKDTVNHYGKAKEIAVEKVAMSSYHEYGFVVGNITLTQGNVVIESGSSASAVVIDMTAGDLSKCATVKANNEKNKEVPIILNATEEQWAEYENKSNIDPSVNNIVYSVYKSGDSYVSYAAAIGSKGYTTIEDALSEVKDGETIIVLKDNDTGSIALKYDKEYTLNLNGHTFSGSVKKIDMTAGKVTIVNGTISDLTSTLGVAIKTVGGTLTLGNNLVISASETDGGEHQAVQIGAGGAGIVIVDGAKISGTGSASGIGVFCGYLTIKSGEIFSENKNGIGMNGSITNDSVVLSILGGTIVANNGAGLYQSADIHSTISGGSISGATGVQCCAGCITVSSGAIKGNGIDSRATKTGDGAILDGADISIVKRSGYPSIAYATITDANEYSIKAYSWASNTATEGTYNSVTLNGVTTYSAL